VEVLAAGLHPRVRSQADGSHYTTTGELPLVPGIDGVLRDPKGRIRYTVLDDTRLGTMAERTVIDLDRSVVLLNGIDPGPGRGGDEPRDVIVGRAPPAHRLPARQGLLVLGATGNAGRMAIQVAKRFGAGRVVAAGRDTDRLAGLHALGADATCTFDELARAADVDVVTDYVWGEPTARAMVDLLSARTDRSAPLTWIEVGSVAGPEAAVPSAALRSARLQLVGIGIGSVPGRDFVKEPPRLASAVADGAFDVRARAVPLAEVEQAWTATAGLADRIVFVP
jgi:NADPH:quinone reductase-like Zn-dependent oxidoreductase